VSNIPTAVLPLTPRFLVNGFQYLVSTRAVGILTIPILNAASKPVVNEIFVTFFFRSSGERFIASVMLFICTVVAMFSVFCKEVQSKCLIFASRETFFF